MPLALRQSTSMDATESVWRAKAPICPPGTALAQVRIRLHNRLVEIAGDIFGFAGLAFVLEGSLGIAPALHL